MPEPGPRDIIGMNFTAKAAATSVGLTGLFFIVYPFCNWIASRRAHVPSFYVHWERSIPFVPIFIIPYASINLFFAAAPFVTTSDRERMIVAKRIVAAMFISAICFLLIPLRFAFSRPEVHGILSMLFDSLHAFDRPFNQFPSLHVAFCVILANLYLRRWGGVLRYALAIWFVLIVIATLFSYQHHVVDIAGGIAVAVICIGLFRDGATRHSASGVPCARSSIS
jgi:membrane-associated phospholipid phosphatase